MTQNDRLAVLEREPRKCPVENLLPFASFEGGRRGLPLIHGFGKGRFPVRPVGHQDLSARPPEQVPTSVDRNATHPSGEPRLSSEVPEGQVSFDKGVLSNILGSGGIADHSVHQVMHQILVPLDQEGVGLPYTGQTLCDDHVLVGGSGTEPEFYRHIASTSLAGSTAVTP